MDYLLAIPLYGFGLFSRDHASQAAVSAALLGVFFHITITQVIDLDEFIHLLVAILPLSLLGLSFTYYVLRFNILETAVRMCVVVGSFNAGLFSSMVIYRLFFHRLRKFPGPLDVKVSTFFAAFRTIRSDVKYHKVVAGMHEEYGDFVRVAPRELCIVRKSAVPIIYGPNSKCRKSSFYSVPDSDDMKSSLHTVKNHDNHRIRRRAWDKGFSIKALNTYEPRIKVLVDKLVSQISQHKRPVDGTEWSMYLTFDVMGSVGFGQDFGCVSSATEHPAIKAIHEHMGIIGVMSRTPWLLNLIARIPGAAAGYSEFFGYCRSQIQAKRKNFQPDQYPQDIMSWLLKAIVERDASASPTEESLNEDSRLLIVAGSETNATTLAATLFFLTKLPSVQRKLRAQLDIAIPTPADWTYEKVQLVTYLDNIIDETLRLKPATMIGGHRETPREGIQIDEQYIPGYTEVFVPVQLIQTDPRYWKEATEFVPERWGERSSEMGTDGAPYFPFSSGSYSCPGKNLAIMTLRIALSCLVQSFDISFAPGETGEVFDKEAKDTFSTELPPLMLQFSPRK